MSASPAFSVREALIAAQPPADRLREALRVCSDYLDQHSLAVVLGSLLEGEANRQIVARATSGPVHVGFVFPFTGVHRETVVELAGAAGFSASQICVPSAILARELGQRSHARELPTLLFHGQRADGASVEVFIPEATTSSLASAWIAEEVGTHVGLTLAAPELLPAARKALAAEGFGMPAFMNDEGMDNRERNVTGYFFDRMLAGRSIRFEILKTGLRRAE